MMTTKAKASKEQEAIDSITLLMRHIESEQGIQELTDNVMARGREIMEAQLKKARDEVRKIENRLKFLDGTEQEQVIEEDKEAPPYIRDRPSFSTIKIAEDVEKEYLPRLDPGAEFTATHIRDFLEKAWDIPKDQMDYVTEAGGNLLSSNVRSSLNKLVSQAKIRRVKPGLFAKKGSLRMGQMSIEDFVKVQD